MNISNPESRDCKIAQGLSSLQETIKWRRTYKPPPCEGSVEPSLVWHPSESEVNLANKSDRESRAPFYREDAPILHPVSFDAYSYHHSEPRSKVTFQVRVSQGVSTPDINHFRSQRVSNPVSIVSRSVSPDRGEGGHTDTSSQTEKSVRRV